MLERDLVDEAARSRGGRARRDFPGGWALGSVPLRKAAIVLRLRLGTSTPPRLPGLRQRGPLSAPTFSTREAAVPMLRAGLRPRAAARAGRTDRSYTGACFLRRSVLGVRCLELGSCGGRACCGTWSAVCLSACGPRTRCAVGAGRGGVPVNFMCLRGGAAAPRLLVTCYLGCLCEGGVGSGRHLAGGL